PQVKERDMLVEINHPIAGLIKIVGIPTKLSKTPGRVRAAAPLLGEHTEEILKSLLGYSDERIQILKGEAII
ncbi:MAG: CoA transferase, partial [Deltaproteobacteria bacterium]|nr:CoA transferase [Deltaproteobacteria bacterium]